MYYGMVYILLEHLRTWGEGGAHRSHRNSISLFTKFSVLSHGPCSRVHFILSEPLLFTLGYCPPLFNQSITAITSSCTQWTCTEGRVTVLSTEWQPPCKSPFDNMTLILFDQNHYQIMASGLYLNPSLLPGCRPIFADLCSLFHVSRANKPLSPLHRNDSKSCFFITYDNLAFKLFLTLTSRCTFTYIPPPKNLMVFG